MIYTLLWYYMIRFDIIQYKIYDAVLICYMISNYVWYNIIYDVIWEMFFIIKHDMIQYNIIYHTWYEIKNVISIYISTIYYVIYDEEWQYLSYFLKLFFSVKALFGREKVLGSESDSFIWARFDCCWFLSVIQLTFT